MGRDTERTSLYCRWQAVECAQAALQTIVVNVKHRMLVTRAGTAVTESG
jgi:hypothetical protein